MCIAAISLGYLRTKFTVGIVGFLTLCPTIQPNSAMGDLPWIDEIGPLEIISVNSTSGYPGSEVRFTGRSIHRATEVLFNDIPASFNAYNGYMGPEVVAIVPTNAVTGPIKIVTPEGSVETCFSFVVLVLPVLPAPVIDWFSPQSGQELTRVYISGVDLAANWLGANYWLELKFNGVPASWSSFMDKDLIFAHVPTNATTGPITVTTPAGSFTTSSNFVVIPLKPPVITSFSPSESSPPAAGQWWPYVTLRGSNLTHANGLPFVTKVLFNGLEANWGVNIAMDGSIWAYIPPKAATGPITVFNRVGSFTTSSNFVVHQPPMVVGGFAPKMGEPEELVEIYGTNLEQNVRRVLFGTQEAAFQASTSLIRTWIPREAESGPIRLVTEDGILELEPIFRVLRLLWDGFSPDWGSAGSLVVMNGTDFVQVREVLFGQISARFELDQLLYVWVPEGATNGPITLRLPHRSITSSNEFRIESSGPLRLSHSIWTPTVLQGSPVSIEVMVTNDSPVLRSHVTLECRAELPDLPVLDVIAWQNGWSSQGGLTNKEGVITATIGDLQPGTAVSISLPGIALRKGIIKNEIVVYGDEGQQSRVPLARSWHRLRVLALNEMCINRQGDGKLEVSWYQGPETMLFQSANTCDANTVWMGTLSHAGNSTARRVCVDSSSSPHRYYRLIPAP
jgi:hypothetical protein